MFLSLHADAVGVGLRDAAEFRGVVDGHAFFAFKAVGEEGDGEGVCLVLNLVDAEGGVALEPGGVFFFVKEDVAELVGAGEALPVFVKVLVDADVVLVEEVGVEAVGASEWQDFDDDVIGFADFKWVCRAAAFDDAADGACDVVHRHSPIGRWNMVQSTEMEFDAV